MRKRRGDRIARLTGALLLAWVGVACGSSDDSGSTSSGGSAGSAASGGSSGSATGGSAGSASGGTSTGGTAGSAGLAGAGGAAGASGGAAGAGGGAGASGQGLVAATVNTRCLLDNWDQRKGPLADGIAAVDPDVLALQEVCHTANKDALTELVTLISQKTGKTYDSVRYDTHYNWAAFADEGVAVVTPHTIAFQKTVDLPYDVFKRGAIVTRIQAPTATLIFSATHLDIGLPDTRTKELAATRAAAEAERKAGEPVIVAGDMNEGPAGACIQDAVAAGYVDTWKQLYPSDPGLTSPSDNPTNRIDYLFLSDPAGSLPPKQAAVFLDHAVGGVWPSDHRGVWARFGP